MATAGDGPSAATSSAYGNGGVGGKFNKPSFRRNRATPYDRPPTASRNPSWLSKLVVDPAKKLISSSANRVFSSVFRKQLSLPAPPESSPESRDRIQAPVVHKPDEEPESANANSQNPTSKDRCGMLELEQLLKQKNFTRSEIDRLTNLLKSKAGDIPTNEEAKGLGTGPLEPVTDIQKHQQLKGSPFSGRGTEIGRSQSLLSAPDASARVLDEDIASPAEIAKAYMDRLPSKVSPAILSLRSQAIGKNGTLSSNVPFTPKSVVLSWATKTGDRFELGENGFTTPKFRGRSAIHNMARTPYSRVYTTASAKVLSSPTLLDQGGIHGSTRLAQKRGSSALDDLGSVGPIRRIRQKHGLVSHKFASPSGLGASGDVQKPLSHKQPFMNAWNGTSLKSVQEEANTPRTNYAHVPPKSSETAAKILQQLENFAPKEKSPEINANASGDKSPSNLTTEMLTGPASKNLEISEQSKMLQSNQNHKKLEDSSRRGVHGLEDNTSGKQKIAEEKAPGNGYSQPETTPLVNGDAVVLGKRILTGGETSDSATISVVQQSRKRAFTFSAHEDDKKYCDGPVLEGKGKRQAYAANHDLSFVAKPSQDRTLVTGVGKIPPEPVLGKTTELGNHIEGTSSAFSAFPLPTTTLKTVKHPSTFSALEKEKKVASSAVASVAEYSGAKSGVASVAEYSGAKSGLFVQQEPQSLSRSAGDNGLLLQAPVFGKHDDTSSQEASKVKEKPTAQSSDAFGSSMSGSPSVSPPDSLNYKNGPFNITPSTSPSSLGSAGFANQTHTSFSSSAATLANGISSANTSAGSSIPSLGGTSFDVGSGSTTAPKSVACQFGSSASSPSYGTSGVAPLTPTIAASSIATSVSVPNIFSFTASSSGAPSAPNVVSSGSSTTPAPFVFGQTSSANSIASSGAGSTVGNFGVGTWSSSAGISASSASVAPFHTYGSSLNSSQSSFSPPFSTASSTGFSFTSTPSFNAANPASTGFGSSTTASSGPVFSFAATSASTSSLPAPFATSSMFGNTASTSTPSIFGNTASTTTASMFGNAVSTVTASGNHDQMSTDDSMAEDTVQSSHTGFPTFGQQPVPSPGGFTFGPTVQQSSPFQFVGIPSQSAPGIPSQSAPQQSPFQPSGSLEFNTSGSFSIGIGGGAGGSSSFGVDKSARKMVKINRNKHRKK